MWPSYVEKSLIPRIHGFEILMASYTIAHLKLALTLKNTGYDGHTDKRLNVFLTNSLEEATPRATNLFAKWLSDEADAASLVKTETPIMVATGNPPYSISSQNSGEWITNLVADYKKNLNERNIQPLSDDYIKFIRLGQYYVHKNGEGILAYISNNGFLDGIVFREMRKCLLDEFDKIFILNLHGNARRGETTVDGKQDENVFDIMQGVSINIFVKTGKTKGASASLFYSDLYGDRQSKYNHLLNGSLLREKWVEVKLSSPFWFFSPKDFSGMENYNSGFKIDELFIVQSSGITFRKDNLFVHFSQDELDKMLCMMDSSASDESIAAKYSIKENEDWNLKTKRRFFQHASGDALMKVAYRPFDFRYCFYPSKDILQQIILRGDHRYDKMQNFMRGRNRALLISRQCASDWRYAFVTDMINEMNLLSNAGMYGRGYVFPLYVYDESGSPVLNCNESILGKLSEIIGNDIDAGKLMDYIYAILYSDSYRQTYKEFLKIDFPRIPYPKDAEQFHRLAEKGGELRKLHLMENAETWKTGVTFPVPGSNVIDSISFTEGKVFINKEQYFGNVSELAWNFYIGGYQPAQKWLKDRKGRTLDFQDILHYGRIIYALQETDRIMKEIDEIGVV